MREVWVSTLGIYNAGALVGSWYDVDDAEDLDIDSFVSDHYAELIRARVSLSEVGEELWCFDTEGFPDSVGEVSPMEAAEWDRTLTELEDRFYGDSSAVAAFIDLMGTDSNFDAAKDDAELIGVYDSEADYAMEYVESVGADDMGFLSSYIDYDALGSDLLASEPNSNEYAGKLYIFAA